MSILCGIPNRELRELDIEASQTNEVFDTPEREEWNMGLWAENEVRIVKSIEEADLIDGEFDYGGACYDSALKAFKSLMDDGHSGFSIQMTKGILIQLLDHRPLTPIVDTDDIWFEPDICGDFKMYQCQRRTSLFKYVYDDGRIEYSDVDRHYCTQIGQPDVIFSSGSTAEILDQMYPITMPYTAPAKKYHFIVNEFLTDEVNGDYDTVGIIELKEPDGKVTTIHRFYKETKKEGKTEWEEIGLMEYVERYENRIRKEGEVDLNPLEG